MVDLIGILLHDADLPNCSRQYAKEQWNYNPETCWAKSYGANENLIQTNRLKRGKTHATKSWLVLG